MTEPDHTTTRDGFFGGRLTLLQRRDGHRAGTDAILLVASVPRDFAGLVCDVGADTGVVGLGAALFAPGASVVLVERDPVAAVLARANAAHNLSALANGGDGSDERVSVATGDLFDADWRQQALPMPIDLLLTNPPFHDAARSRPSPSGARRAAHHFGAETDLAAWLRTCRDLVAPCGTLVTVLPAAALPAALDALGGGLGATALFVHPRAGITAKRVLVRLRRGSRASFAVAPPLFLHGEVGFTAVADQLHRGEATLDW